MKLKANERKALLWLVMAAATWYSLGVVMSAVQFLVMLGMMFGGR